MQRTDAGPARAIQPIDLTQGNVTFTAPPRSIYVGTDGDITVDGVLPSGAAVTNVTFKNFPGGRELPVACVTKVVAATTTAGYLVALW